jgi:hypothetical protein
MAQDASPEPQPGITGPTPADTEVMAERAEPVIEIDVTPSRSPRGRRDPYTDVLLRNTAD